MKKQNIKTPITKEELIDILKDYPTKDNLNEHFIAFHKAFSSEMDYKLNFFREEIREDSSKFANLILTAIDPLMKELETRREDREITTAQIEEVRSRIKNHEKRITKLEHV